MPTKPNPPAAPRGLARVNPNLRPGTQTQLLTFATSLPHKVLTTAFAAEIRPRGRLGGRGRRGFEFHNKINRGSVEVLPRAAWGRQYWSAPTEGLPHRAGRRPAPPSSSAQPAGNTEFFAQGSRYSPTPPARPTPSWGSRGPGGWPKSPKRGPVEERGEQNLNPPLFGVTRQAGTGAGWSRAKWVLYYSTAPPV